MSNKMFMRVEEVAEEMGVSLPYAYKLIRQLNKELKATGCITIAGRIDRKFFHEKFYSTKTTTERGQDNGSI
jgi:putative transcriptional regulator